MSRTEQDELYRSVRKIRLRSLDAKHFELFVNSVLLEARQNTPIPALVTEAIVTPYGANASGKLVRALAIPWNAIIRELSRDWNLAYQVPPEKWEELVAGAFDRAGYLVTLTPRSNDHGRDVIAVKNGVGSIRIIDSVKAYTPGHPVRHDDVRALAGVLLGDQQASKGIVTTTSTFAPGIPNDPFIKPLIPYRLELMDGTALRSWLEELALSRRHQSTSRVVLQS